jgi:hypothetical protein
MTTGFCVPEASALARDGRLDVCTGTRLRVEADGPYVTRARVPSGAWRKPTMEELATLHAADGHPNRSLELAELVVGGAVPDHPALELGQAISRSPDGLGSRTWTALQHEAVDLLAHMAFPGDRGFRSATEVRIGRDDPRLATTTRDPSSGHRLLGLHVDSQERRPLHERERSKRLFNVNIAAEPRWFLFVNVDIGTQARHLLTIGNDDVERLGATDTGRAFLADDHTCPVFRIRLDPGQGYLAPVQNMVHDGSTENALLCGLRACAFGDVAA